MLKFSLEIVSLLLKLARKQVVVLSNQALDLFEHESVVEGRSTLMHLLLMTHRLELILLLKSDSTW